MSRVLMILGLLIALASAALLLAGVIESGVAVAIGILGMGLIAAAGSRHRTGLGAQPEQVLRTIYSPDRQLRALIRHRADRKYQVEIQKFIHEYSPEVGSHDRWERQSNEPITDELATAVEIAAHRIGAGTGDFFGNDA